MSENKSGKGSNANQQVVNINLGDLLKNQIDHETIRKEPDRIIKRPRSFEVEPSREFVKTPFKKKRPDLSKKLEAEITRYRALKSKVNVPSDLESPPRNLLHGDSPAEIQGLINWLQEANTRLEGLANASAVSGTPLVPTPTPALLGGRIPSYGPFMTASGTLGNLASFPFNLNYNRALPPRTYLPPPATTANTPKIWVTVEAVDEAVLAAINATVPSLSSNEKSQYAEVARQAMADLKIRFDSGTARMAQVQAMDIINRVVSAIPSTMISPVTSASRKQGVAAGHNSLTKWIQENPQAKIDPDVDLTKPLPIEEVSKPKATQADLDAFQKRITIAYNRETKRWNEEARQGILSDLYKYRTTHDIPPELKNRFTLMQKRVLKKGETTPEQDEGKREWDVTVYTAESFNERFAEILDKKGTGVGMYFLDEGGSSEAWHRAMQGEIRKIKHILETYNFKSDAAKREKLLLDHMLKAFEHYDKYDNWREASRAYEDRLESGKKGWFDEDPTSEGPGNLALITKFDRVMESVDAEVIQKAIDDGDSWGTEEETINQMTKLMVLMMVVEASNATIENSKDLSNESATEYLLQYLKALSDAKVMNYALLQKFLVKLKDLGADIDVNSYQTFDDAYLEPSTPYKDLTGLVLPPTPKRTTEQTTGSPTLEVQKESLRVFKTRVRGLLSRIGVAVSPAGRDNREELLQKDLKHYEVLEANLTEYRGLGYNEDILRQMTLSLAQARVALNNASVQTPPPSYQAEPSHPVPSPGEVPFDFQSDLMTPQGVQAQISGINQQLTNPKDRKEAMEHFATSHEFSGEALVKLNEALRDLGSPPRRKLLLQSPPGAASEGQAPSLIMHVPHEVQRNQLAQFAGIIDGRIKSLNRAPRGSPQRASIRENAVQMLNQARSNLENHIKSQYDIDILATMQQKIEELEAALAN